MMARRIVFLCVGGLLCGCMSTQTPRQSYSSKGLHMQLLLPAEWQVQPLPGRTDKVYLKIPGEELGQACVQVTFKKLPAGFRVDELVSASAKLFKQTYPNATVSSPKRVVLGGREIHILLVLFGSVENPYMQKTAYLFKDGYSYAFAYAATADRFPKYEPQFDRILTEFAPQE